MSMVAILLLCEMIYRYYNYIYVYLQNTTPEPPRRFVTLATSVEGAGYHIAPTHTHNLYLLE